MKDEQYISREFERAGRLREFVKGELRSMYVEARFQFTIDLFNYLKPEIESLLKDKKIDARST